MFWSSKSMNAPLENWDVSNVTKMDGMFSGASSFNQPLEKWDVSNVTNMREMFCDASSFNQPQEKWDVSNVTDMERMFEGDARLIFIRGRVEVVVFALDAELFELF